jgi:formate hydrogenlyase transcriptional activator
MSFADRRTALSERMTELTFHQKNQWITPRSILVLSAAIVPLHLLQQIIFGTNSAGPLIANFLQIFSALLAAVTCFAAIRRSSGFTRSFWLLIGLSFMVWALADLGWMYYESLVHVSPPRNSIFHFLSDCRSLFLAVALLLDQTEERPWYFFDLASLLDTVQLFIVFFLIYLGWYHVPSLHASVALSVARSDEIEIGEASVVVGLAVLQAFRARTPELRKLYSGFLICFTPLSVGVLVTDYRELRLLREIPTGTWLDLWWTIPFLMAAFWAAQWQQPKNLFVSHEAEQPFFSTFFENTIYAAGPLIVLLQVTQLGPEWRTISFILLGISIFSFGVRLALSKFRESRAVLRIRQATEALIESEDRYRDLVEHSEDLVCTHDLQGKLLSVNPAPARVLGYRVGELLQMPMRDLLAPEFRKEFDAYLERMKTVGADRGILCVLTKGGDRRLWQYSNTLRTTGVPSPIVRGMAHDITERKRAETAFRASEQRYRTLFEKTVAGVGIVSLGGVILDCNDAWARMFGYKAAADMRGKETPNFYPDPGQGEEFLTELKRSGVFLNKELKFRRLDGSPFWVLMNSILISMDHGEPVIQTTLFDVTERMWAEEARKEAVRLLRQREEHFRLLVEQAYDGIFVTDATGRFLDVNSAAAAMVGYTREELLQLSTTDMVDASQVQAVLREREIVQQGRDVRTEWMVRRKDGTYFAGEVTGRRLPNGQVQGIIRDMTERRRVEQELRQNEERFRVALTDSPITVFNQDHNLRYTWIYNPQLYWQHDVLGKTDEDILGKKKAASLTALKTRVVESGTAVREDVAISLNDSRYVFEMTIEPLFGAEGKVVGITGACVDVARLRDMADRLQASRDQIAREKAYLETQIQTELGFEDVIGQSPALKEVLRKAQIVAPTDSTVLLLGETGTGKELIARSLHALSMRREKTFVKLNCAAVPSGLLESELFGHEKGAFTGAVSQKIGRIELADKGTLFLDEIGEMPLELQPKLLRVLQDREFERLGGVRTLRVDVRIISATNRDLLRDVEDRKFREDLFYRLNVFPIELPALRSRKEDIPMLVHHFVDKHAAKMGKHIDAISDEVMQVLKNWNWPGNVRELENMIERMVILSKGRVLARPPAELVEANHADDDHLTEMEREHIIRVLRETNGVLSGIDGAAVRLGLKRTTLQSMMKRLGIEAHEYRGRGNA